MLLVVGLIACGVLYQFLNIYEVTRPETLMDEMMDLMEAEDWLDKAGKNLDFELSEFEDAQALYADYRASLTTDQPLSYRSEKKASDSEHAVFVVRCGPSNLCTVELVRRRSCSPLRGSASCCSSRSSGLCPSSRQAWL